MGCSKLNNVVIPASVVKIGDYAFADCTGLTDITFTEKGADDTPYILGEHVFEGCTSLSESILPGGTTPAPTYVSASSGIVGAVIPESVTGICAQDIYELSEA